MLMETMELIVSQVAQVRSFILIVDYKFVEIM